MGGGKSTYGHWWMGWLGWRAGGIENMGEVRSWGDEWGAMDAGCDQIGDEQRPPYGHRTK